MKDRLKKCSKLDLEIMDDDITNHILDDPSRLITLMYLLEAGRLDSTDIDVCCRKLSAMANFFVNVSNDLQEAFFLFRNFTRKLEENGTVDKIQL